MCFPIRTQGSVFPFSDWRGDDGTAESRRIVFFGRLTLLDPADTSFLWGCFTAAMTASRGGVEGSGESHGSKRWDDDGAKRRRHRAEVPFPQRAKHVCSGG